MRILLLLIALSFAFTTSVFAKTQKRYALLIGNKDYQLKTLNLTNPHNDITSVGVALKKIGFEVRFVRDADYATLKKETTRFTSRLRRAGKGAIGFFYYSGHGAMDPATQVNYIIPSDISDTSTRSLWDDSVRLSGIIRELRDYASNATHFVVFDACRNELQLTSPDTKSLYRPKGFKAIRQQPRMLISYATEAGNMASDNGKSVGHYARILSEELVKPGVEVTNMFRNVQLRVAKTIGQEPWVTYNALPEFYFAGKERVDVKEWTAIESGEDIAAFEKFLQDHPNSSFRGSAQLRIKVLREKKLNTAASRDWEDIETSTDISVLEAYVKKYPDHTYARFARFRILELEKKQKREKMQLAWNAAKQSVDIGRLQQFISDYPDSLYAEVAKDYMSGLRKQQKRKGKESLAARYWEEIQNSNDADALRKFLQRFPQSPYALQALSQLQEISEKEKKKLASLTKKKAPQITEVLPPKKEPQEDTPSLSLKELTKSLQRELARVGCNPGRIDGAWGARGRQALTRFNKYARMKLDVISPTISAIEKIRQQRRRICPAPTPTKKIVKPEKNNRTRKKKTVRNLVNRPDPLAYSDRVWSFGSVPTGASRSAKTKWGTLHCVGGNRSLGIPRRCSWR